MGSSTCATALVSRMRTSRPSGEGRLNSASFLKVLRSSTHSAQKRRLISDNANVLGFLALFSGRSVELDELTLFEALVAVALDIGEMDEDVITLLARDEAEALFCIKKFHCSLCHDYSI